MLRTVFLTSLVALLAVIYLYVDRDALSLKFFSGQKATVQGQSAASHVSATSYASTPSVKPSETYSASFQDYSDPRIQAQHPPVESAPSDQPSPDGQQPLLPGPDEMPADDAAILSEEAQLERLGPIVVNSDGTLSRIDNWQDMTKAEKTLTLKRLKKRNAQRLKQLKEQMNAEGKTKLNDCPLPAGLKTPRVNSVLVLPRMANEAKEISISFEHFDVSENLIGQ